MAMKDDDYQLSMKISQRGKINSADLRSLLVNRLSDTNKLVMRRPLQPTYRGPLMLGVYCEPCKRWTDTRSVTEEIKCWFCGRHYRVEMVVYEEIDPPEPQD